MNGRLYCAVEGCNWANNDRTAFCDEHEREVAAAIAPAPPRVVSSDPVDYKALYFDAVTLLRNAPRPELYFDEQRFGEFPFDEGFGKWYHSAERREHIVRIYGGPDGSQEEAPQAQIREGRSPEKGTNRKRSRR